MSDCTPPIVGKRYRLDPSRRLPGHHNGMDCLLSSLDSMIVEILAVSPRSYHGFYAITTKSPYSIVSWNYNAAEFPGFILVEPDLFSEE